MKERSFAPRKMDIGAFIESGEPMNGAVPVPELPRVAQGLAEEVDAASLPPVTWSALGRVVPQRVGEPHLWLDIQADASLAFACQRCLQAVTLPVQLERAIRFV